ncbi:MAG: aminotransferase class I/II-fold pyridoxal phosphate-dependent enzyme [Candidatus Spechtbacteria bacterium SB0662_bin_43]|uniref:Aminotransferase class I/II-fold pyridoxal phosphate-dependent enzyme n=1 Tax=Candidatus Spechtbacteria bacterium SB0662_bin_43 TaxID=2604897 RepID=A0A845DKZ8_9BACT|nr:aminotransferase class I/II-fold pyridoxal phosphate-dependent enzyme [Candidatus Spechtbacteria bacterium SB0662_bin_43]
MIVSNGIVLHISLSPNVQKSDVWRSIRLFFLFWRWKHGDYTARLTKALESRFGGSVYLTNSGRSALYVALRGAGVQRGDEVLLQAFSCNAVVNPILWVGATPVYCDIEEDTYNLSAADVRKKITKRTKVIILQHTFGISADIAILQGIARQNNILVIEDCAHSLGATHNEKNIGSFGDVAIFSFGRDKVISSVYGGGVVAQKQHKEGIETAYKEECSTPSYWWIAQQLLHIPLTFVALKLYRYSIGKVILVIAQKTKMLSKAVTSGEKKGEMPAYFPCTLPNSLAAIAFSQFERLSLFNAHRQNIARLYADAFSGIAAIATPRTKQGDIFLRYPIQCDNAATLIRQAKKRHIILGDWYKNVIDPVGTDKEKMQYRDGMCPVAEWVAERVVNLPTHIHTTQRDAEIIIHLVVTT